MRLLTVLLLASPLFANGIHVPDADVRMTRHRAHAKVADRAARVTVWQTFLNTTDRELEGTYLFPLPRGASVSSFAMTMGGTMVKGEILDAQRAREIYLSIVRERRDPGLLEWCGRNVYRARVFPIPARGEVEIELTYEQLLPADGGIVELQYPLASELMNRAPVERVLVDVEYAGKLPLKSVWSPSHAIGVIRRGGTGARVTYESGRVRPDRNLQVYFSRSVGDLGLSVLSHRDEEGRGTFLAMLGYDAGIEPEELMPRAMVYVLDTSGSMGGEKIEQAKEALAGAVSMLRSQDSFTMIGFATELDRFRRGLVPATDENRAAAGRWIRAREAKGGTAICDALEAAVGLDPGDKLPIVVFLTDGRPTVGPQKPADILVRVGAANRRGARVFTFGIGDDLDVVLLDRIAEATRGKRDYIAPGEEIGTVTRRFFRRIDQPVAQDVVLETGEGIEAVYPRRIGDLFAADQIVVLGRYARPGKTVFTLRGTRNGQPFERRYEATLREGPGVEALPRIWAQRKVAFLWDQMRLHGESKELKDEIVRLGTKYSIVTPYTSGLVVEGTGTSSASPIFFASRQDEANRRRRGPRGGVPPGLREPTDPEAPRGPTTPSGPTTPGEPVADPQVAKSLRGLKEAGRALDQGDRILAAGKTFVWFRDRGWVDTAYRLEQTPKKIVAFSDAYFELVARDKRVAKWLAIGKWVTFVHDGRAYRVEPEGS